MDISDRLEQFRCADRFEKISACACAQAVKDGVAVVVAGQHDHMRWSWHGCEGFDDFNPAGVGEVHVHQDHVGAQGGYVLDGGVSVAEGADAGYGRIGSEHESEASADARIVFDKSDGNGC